MQILESMVFKKIGFLVLISFITACNQDTGVFSIWKNKISLKKIDLSEAKENQIGKLQFASDCEAKLKLLGDKHMGDIHVGHSHGNCENEEVPVKMNYKLTQKGLKVCSDFKSGKHQCEFLKKNK